MAPTDADEAPLVPPLPTTDEAISTTLKCIQFCIDKNGATSMKNMIKNKGPEALLKLLSKPNHLAPSLALLLRTASYGQAGAKSMTFADGVDLLQQNISTVADEIIEAGASEPQKLPSLVKTLNDMLSLLFDLTTFIVEEPTAKIKADDEEETSTVPPLPVITSTTLTLNKILSLSTTVPTLSTCLSLFSLSQILTTKSLGNIARFSEECRSTICQNGSLPIVLSLLATPKMIVDTEAETDIDPKKAGKKDDKKPAGKDKKKKGKEDPSAPPPIEPPPVTPREGDPIGYR